MQLGTQQLEKIISHLNDHPRHTKASWSPRYKAKWQDVKSVPNYAFRPPNRDPSESIEADHGRMVQRHWRNLYVFSRSRFKHDTQNRGTFFVGEIVIFFTPSLSASDSVFRFLSSIPLQSMTVSFIRNRPTTSTQRLPFRCPKSRINQHASASSLELAQVNDRQRGTRNLFIQATILPPDYIIHGVPCTNTVSP